MVLLLLVFLESGVVAGVSVSDPTFLLLSLESLAATASVSDPTFLLVLLNKEGLVKSAREVCSRLEVLDSVDGVGV